jgi:hypothetical protein
MASSMNDCAQKTIRKVKVSADKALVPLFGDNKMNIVRWLLAEVMTIAGKYYTKILKNYLEESRELGEIWIKRRFSFSR